MFRFFRKHARWILISVVVIFGASVFYGLGFQSLRGGNSQDNQGVIARIDGKAIALRHFNQMLNAMMSQQKGPYLPQDLLNLQSLALDQAIDYTLLLREAKRKQKVNRQELDSAIEGVMKGQEIKDEEALKAILKRNGVDYQDFRQGVKEDILVQKLMRGIKNVAVTPNDLREVRVSHILVSSKEAAEEILAQIKKGEDFASLAKEYSTDPGSKTKGGDLGYFALGRMVPEFEEAAFSLKVGEVSDPVKTNYGYHILKLENTRLKKVKEKGAKLEDEILVEKKERVFRNWFNPVKQKAKVEILDPLLKANDLRFKGRIQESIAEFLNAARTQPSNPYPYLLLGDTYSLMGEKDLALKQYERAVEIAPGNIYTYISLGQAYLAQNKTQKARESFEKASIVAGDSKDYHDQLLQIFEKQGLAGQAAKEKQVLRKIEEREALKQQLIEESRKKQATP